MGHPTTTPPPPSCPSWCTAEHTPNHLDHSADIGMWALDGGTIEVILRQKPGDRLPLVRVLFGPDWAPSDILDMPVEAASKLGRIIGMHDVRSYMEFGQALSRAAGLAGGRGAQW